MTTNKRPVGRPRLDGRAQLTRDQLIDAAAKLMSQYGYSGTSIRMIAQELNVTTASVFNYYPSKRELFSVVMRTVSTPVFAFHKALAKLSLAPSEELFKTIVEDAMAVITAPHHLVALFYLPELRQAEFAKESAYRKRMAAHYRMLIEQGVSTGEFVAQDPIWMAEQTLQLTETNISANVKHSKQTARRRAVETARFCLRGLLVPEPEISRVEKVCLELKLAIGGDN